MNNTDPKLETIKSELLRLDPDGSIFAEVIRETIDQLLDGRRTGRWDYSELYKTEKTHLGTLLEINLQRRFAFADGDVTDFKIADIDVDCKYSKTIGGWELGPEMINQYLLVIWASDIKSEWRAGVVKAAPQYLSEGENRDKKKHLNAVGRGKITWLWPENGKLPPNQLLHMEPQARERIMVATTRPGLKTSVPARITQLLRELQNVIIRRTTIETVAYGADDPMKRTRANGGARDPLQSEGIVVLGHQGNDPLVAVALGFPRPIKGELLSVRLIEVSGSTQFRPAAEIGGKYYAVASTNDPVLPAPTIPKK